MFFKKHCLFITLILIIPFCSLAQDIELEPLIIERGRYEFNLQGTEYFSENEIESLPFNSLEEIVEYSSSIDLRKRSPFGIQQDVSLRGSIFEDTEISLNGIRINDPQTGHFNLEIPLTSADLEEVQISKNSQRINFAVKKPEDKGFLLRSFFGQHALREQLLSFNFGTEKFKNRVSVEHKISKGARADTDFEIYNFSFNSLWEDECKELEFLFGSTKRDFGADSFYSSMFTQEEEHTTQRFFLGRGMLKGESFDWNNTVYLRRHTDKFILIRGNPSFYTNDHKTYTYGLKSALNFHNNMFLSLHLDRETIDSTNLSKHYRLKKGFSLGTKERRIGDFIFDFEAGLDYYEGWEYLENVHLGLGYFLKDNLKARFSFDRIWRAPSFTELYYVSPANVGNPNLGIQRSNNFEVGLDFSPNDNLDLIFNVFLRDQANTIDWVRNSLTAPWAAQNVGDLKSYGFDFYAELDLDNAFLDRVALGYTYLDLDKDNPYNFSKYVFDYNRHKLVGIFGFDIKGVSVNLIANYANPVNRKHYTTADIKIEKKFKDFRFIIEGINIFNKPYQELGGINSSGRWYKVGIEYSF